MNNLFLRFIKVALFFCLSIQCSFAQNVGINNSGAAPHAAAMLHIDIGSSDSKGFLVDGSGTLGTVPDLGPGKRMMFFPAKAAFRAGSVPGNQWDNANVGKFSFATGQNTVASGLNSTALGFATTASGRQSTAIGWGTTAFGEGATAMGSQTDATGRYSTAMGYGTTASNDYSVAMGWITTASGIGSIATGDHSTAIGTFSTAMGANAHASGLYSMALGSSLFASGNYSTAMGHKVSTNSQAGAFIIGDADPNNEGETAAGSPNQFVARFWNGYYFMSSGTNVRFGVSIPHNGNSWLSICDANLKENFVPLDGEGILQKFSNIKFSSWNYKKQDPKNYRHYGIMAQDFYNAFGKDSYGIIGNDTTVNPIDMIGIDMAAIQALEKRTADLKLENDKLQQSLQVLQQKFDEQQQLLNSFVKTWKEAEEKKSR